MRPVDNPFSATRQHRLKYKFPKTDCWKSFLLRLDKNSWSGAIVGDKGNGKTTFMLELETILKSLDLDVRLLFLNDEKMRFSSKDWKRIKSKISQNTIYLFDGSEQLSTLRWWQFIFFVRKAKGVVITRHSVGRLKTILEASSTFELFVSLVASLLEDRNQIYDLIPDDTLHLLYDKHQGNIRLAFFDLYDLISGGFCE